MPLLHVFNGMTLTTFNIQMRMLEDLQSCARDTDSRLPSTRTKENGDRVSHGNNTTVFYKDGSITKMTAKV